MAIDIATLVKQAEQNRGIITDDVVLSGDLSGNLPNPDVVSIRGKTIPSTGAAEGMGLRIGNDGNYEYQTLLTEDSTFGGDLSGSQAGGVTVRALSGNQFEITSPSEGQVLKFDGSGILVNSDESGGLGVIVADNADVTATNNSIVFVNTITNSVSVTAPTSPVIGDFFYIKDSHGAFLTNNCNVIGTVEGDPTGAVLASNNILIMFQYNGTDWRYSVLWGGH